jgi:dolichyl-phosphate beta-glucosyltransferase
VDLSEAPATVLRRHPWELARREFFRRRIRSLGLDRRPIEVLDVGSGDAWLATSLLPALHADSRLTCWDSGYREAHLEDLGRRFAPRARFVTARPAQPFDLVLLLDVLEHVENDAEFLGGIVAANLRAGAHALISVPAWQTLFGDHDVRLPAAAPGGRAGRGADRPPAAAAAQRRGMAGGSGGFRGRRGGIAMGWSGVGAARERRRGAPGTELVGNMREAILVVPCFNEAERLRGEEFLALSREADLGLVFVDDGSTDRTAERIGALVARAADRVELLRLARNAGKGEAVRQGLLRAIGSGASLVGYADADLSTPAAELARLAGELRGGAASVVMGSRIRLLGRQIERNPARHYLGRVFATCASLALGIPVYDTQCGAKWFRVTPVLEAALARPFESRWVFDVELIGRLLRRDGRPGYGVRDFLEVPLGRWSDVQGSKLGPVAVLEAGFDLLRIAWSLRGSRNG